MPRPEIAVAGTDPVVSVAAGDAPAVGVSRVMKSGPRAVMPSASPTPKAAAPMNRVRRRVGEDNRPDNKNIILNCAELRSIAIDIPDLFSWASTGGLSRFPVLSVRLLPHEPLQDRPFS